VDLCGCVLIFQEGPDVSTREFQLLQLGNTTGSIKKRVLTCMSLEVIILQQQKQQILDPTGKKMIEKIVSAEKGETITAVVCISASGSFVPPMLIFPHKNLSARLMNGAPSGTIGATSTSGWINGDLYMKWLKHFIEHTEASVGRKVLLILDNHESHMTLQA